MKKIERMLYRVNEFENRLKQLDILLDEIVEVSSIDYEKISTSKTNEVSNRTESIALSKVEILEERIKIHKSLDLINGFVDVLCHEEKTIIRLRYFNKLAWADIADHISFSIRQCYRKRDVALDQLIGEFMNVAIDRIWGEADELC